MKADQQLLFKTKKNVIVETINYRINYSNETNVIYINILLCICILYVCNFNTVAYLWGQEIFTMNDESPKYVYDFFTHKKICS